MKNKILGFIIVFLCLFVPSHIYADDSAHSGGSGNNVSCGNYICYGTSDGLRFSLVDKNGNRIPGTKSIDVFLDTRAKGYLSTDYCRRYTKYTTKKEFLDGTGHDRSNCSGYEYYYLSDLKLSGTDFSMSDSHSLENRLHKLFLGLDGSDGVVDPELQIGFNHLLAKLFSVSAPPDSNKEWYADKLSNLSTPIEDIYLEVDQIMIFYNNHKSNASANTAFVGMISQVYYYYRHHFDGDVYCLSTRLPNEGTCTVYLYGDGIVTGFYSPIYRGGLSLPSSSTISSFTKTNRSATSVEPSDSFFTSKNTLNVGFMSLNIDPCGSEAKKILNNYSGAELENQLATLARKYPTKITLGGRFGEQSNKKISKLDSLSRAAFGKPNKNACGTYTCDETAKKIFDEYFRTDRDKYEILISKLANSNYFSSYKTLLTTSVWYDLLNLANPSCGNYNPPNCPPTVPTAQNLACENNIKFEDSNCWKEGIAYTGGVSISDAQSSIEIYADAGCSLFCKDKVEFNLPRNVDKVYAGQVFKWGIEQDKSNSLFGTMTITRECTANSSHNTGCKYCDSWDDEDDTCLHYHKVTIPSFGASQGTVTWANKVDTSMKIMYEEPTNREFNKDIELTRNLVSSTGNTESVTCNNESCSNYGTVNTSAVYGFYYPNTLFWSSSKNDQKLYADDSSHTYSTNLYYYSIGYGLATSFTTPTDYYGRGSDGKLSVRIDDIGVNKRFNKIAERTFGHSYIDYSCKFNVVNEIFANECKYDESGNLTADSPENCDPNSKDGNVVDKEKSAKNVDVVFRTVHLMANSSLEQLSRAFPGRSGSGDRKIGTNWVYKDSILTNENKYSVADLYEILNANVYRNTPMYEIKLTVSTIQDIRRLNNNAKTQSKDPYTEMENIRGNDGNGFVGYECKQGSIDKNRNGTIEENEKTVYCASDFLSHLYGLATNPLGGRCVTTTNTSNRAVSYRNTGCE